MSKLLSRIVALLLVPCLVADPATASNLINPLATLGGRGCRVRGDVIFALSPSHFREQALSGRALSALSSIFKGPARLTFESELTATSPLIPPPRQWTDFLPSPSRLVLLAFILTAHHFGHPGLSTVSLAAVISLRQFLSKCMMRMGLNQSQLAELTGVDNSRISGYLRDKRIPTFKTVERLTA